MKHNGGRRMIYLIAAAIFITVCISAAVSQDSDAADAELIGISTESYSPSGNYELDAKYYDDLTLRIIVDYSGDSEHSEIGKASEILLYSTDESYEDKQLVGRLDPIRLDGHMAVKLTTERLDDGAYIIYINNHSHQLIVRCILFVGTVYEMTLIPPEEGTISISGLIYVMGGSIMEEDGEDLTITYMSKEMYRDVPTPPPGYRYKGWYLGEEGDEDPVKSMYIHSDLIVHIEWFFTKLIVTYLPNGGTGEMDPVEVEAKSMHKLRSNRFSPPEGYTFSGWKVNGVTYQPGDEIKITMDTNVYAQWKRVPIEYTYTLKFDANGGTGGPSDVRRTVETTTCELTVPKTIPERSGYSFLGWADTATGKAKYFGGESIKLRASDPSKTLYAEWSEDPKIENIILSIDSLEITPSSSIKINVDVYPPELSDLVVWTSSDDSIFTVSQDGTITALKTGKAVLWISSPDGSVKVSLDVIVKDSPEPYVKERIPTSDGGYVEATYIYDEEGNPIITNPIYVSIGTTSRITYDQNDLVLELEDGISATGEYPQVIVNMNNNTYLAPSEFLHGIVSYHGNLTVIGEGASAYFPYEAVADLDTGDDTEMWIVPTEVKEETDIDPEDLPNGKVYDVYLLINGTLVHRTFSVPVTITAEYYLEPGWTVDKLSVFYIDADPWESLPFKYDDGVIFEVVHFSRYAITYDDEPPGPGPEPEPEGSDGCRWWIFAAIGGAALFLLLILLIVFRKRRIELDLDGVEIVFIPEGWECASDGILYRKYRKGEELDMPMILPADDSMYLVGWLPDPPKEVEKSEQFKAVWSDEKR